MDILTNIAPNVLKYIDQFPKAILDTLIMLALSGIISIFFGLILGVIVVVTRKDGILPNKWVYFILDKIINLFRSIPFIILVPMLAFLSRLIFKTTIGISGAMVPLVVGTIPFVARQMESSMMEIPEGIVEASISMGMSPMQIIFQVYLKENSRDDPRHHDHIDRADRSNRNRWRGGRWRARRHGDPLWTTFYV